MERIRTAWQRLGATKQRYIAFLIALCVLVLGAWFAYATWVAPSVTVVPVERRAMRVGVTETASTMSPHVETITPQFTAKLNAFPVQVGSIVQVGTVLATVDEKSLQEQLEVLRASQEAAGTEEVPAEEPSEAAPAAAPPPASAAALAHAEEMLRQGLITQREYQRLQARMYHSTPSAAAPAATARNGGGTRRGPSLDAQHIAQRIHVLEGLVKNGNIQAPMAGRIGAIYNQDQQLAVEGQPLFTIQQLSPLFATVVLPVNLPASQLFVSLIGPSGAVEGKVLSVTHQGAQTIVKGSFPNEKGTFVPGQFYRMQVGTQVLAEELAIPSAAVHTKDQTSYVYVLTDDNRVDARLVTIGAEEDGYTAIVQGLQDGDRVITTDRNFTIGQRVRPR